VKREKMTTLSVKVPSISRGEAALETHIRQYGLPEPVKQYKFHPLRRWLADFGWPEQKLLVEVEGGVWSEGRHVRGGGYENDCEKYNEAQLMGFVVLRFSTGQVLKGKAVKVITRALGFEEPKGA
jgi:very-short-patch-repair endonuclease